MKTISLYTECLSYEQLQAYTASPNREEHSKLYLHISSCELCSCAVNGFSAIPFVANELELIHQKIDEKMAAADVNILALHKPALLLFRLFLFSAFTILSAVSPKTKQALFPQNTITYLWLQCPRKKENRKFLK